MSLHLRLYSGPLSMFGMKAEIAAREKAIDFDLVVVPFDLTDRYEPKHPDVQRINPKRQVPVLIDGDLEIFDSTQIFEYFEDIKPEPALWPREAKRRAMARSLELQADEIYFPHIIRLMGLQDKMSDPAAVAALESAAYFYERMEKQLAAQDYLAGDFSYADIGFYMAQLFGARMGAEMSDATPKLIAWRERITQRPAVSFVVQRLAGFLRARGRRVPGFMERV